MAGRGSGRARPSPDGAGGLGARLYYALSLFQESQAATVILAMLLLSLAVDVLSGVLRRLA